MDNLTRYPAEFQTHLNSTRIVGGLRSLQELTTMKGQEIVTTSVVRKVFPHRS
jgi:hypothetical protein